MNSRRSGLFEPGYICVALGTEALTLNLLGREASRLAAREHVIFLQRLKLYGGFRVARYCNPDLAAGPLVPEVGDSDAGFTYCSQCDAGSERAQRKRKKPDLLRSSVTPSNVAKVRETNECGQFGICARGYSGYTVREGLEPYTVKVADGEG